MTSILTALADLVAEGRAASLATVVRSEAEGVKPGTKMLVGADGNRILGGIHPDIDGMVARDALRLLPLERSETATYELAGGSVEVFIESCTPPQQLVIVGAVHVAVSLARMAVLLGYRVIVVDPRGVFATRERFPDAEELLVDWPEDAFAGLDLHAATSVVVLTHDAKIDLPALSLALRSEARYVGMIGSRPTVAQRKEELATAGLSPAQLERLHAPIGLDIGARTPAEIAVAILAEIVAVRRGKAR